MRAFLVAVQFLTRLPLPSVDGSDAALRGRSVLYYPLVGLLIGSLLVALAVLLESRPPLLAAALVLLAWVLVTGGLHLDGLADSADAWVGGHGDRERTLAIMKDAASGPAGVSALVLVLLVKFAALTALLERSDAWALLLAPALGRGALLFLLWSTPYVRPGGIGAAQAASLPRAGAVATLLIVAGAPPALLGAHGAALLATIAVLLWALRRLMRRRLGGVTGDTLGASCEIVEAAALVFMALVTGAPAAWLPATGG